MNQQQAQLKHPEKKRSLIGRLGERFHSKRSSRTSHPSAWEGENGTSVLNAARSAADTLESSHNGGDSSQMTNAPVMALNTGQDESEDDDVWRRAEVKLRSDPSKRELLDEYRHLLQKHIESHSQPNEASDPDQVKQVLEYFQSQTKQLQCTDEDTQLSRCTNRAKRLFKNSVRRVAEIQTIFNAAALCVQAADERQVLFEGLGKVAGAICRLAQYEKLLCSKDGRHDQDIKASMTDICTKILEFHARAARYLQQPRAKSVIRDAFKADGWDRLLFDIEKDEELIRKHAERQGWTDIQNVLAKISTQESRRSERFRSERVEPLLQTLSDHGCLYKDSKNRNRERVLHTCNWFTKQPKFDQWSLSTTSPAKSLLYVTADPGCGKSVLSRYLIDEILPDDGRVVCYFFFKDDFVDQKSAHNALCSLLHQLYVLNPDCLTEDVLYRYSHNSRFVDSISELWDMFLAAADHQETVCVLDALDECREADREWLIHEIIKTYTDRSSKATRRHDLKFLLTSRPYGHINRQFSSMLKSQTSSIHIQGEEGTSSDEIAEEIKHVMNSRIDETAQAFELTPEERDLMSKQLESIQNRTYLWITLLFDGLMASSNPRIDKQGILELVKKLPQSVAEAYAKILDKSKDKRETKRILCMILAARRPLTLSEMSMALAFRGLRQSYEDVKRRIIPKSRIRSDIKDRCGLFVTFVDDKVYLLHQTAREFLIRPETTAPEKTCGPLVNYTGYNSTLTIFTAQVFESWLRCSRTCIYHLPSLLFRRLSFALNGNENVYVDNLESESMQQKRITSKTLRGNASCRALDDLEDSAEPGHWKHSLRLEEAHSVLAEVSIAFLRSDFAAEQDALLDYSARFWTDHYRHSEDYLQPAAVETALELCQPLENRQWTNISGYPARYAATGSPLCLASAMGLERVVALILKNDDSINATGKAKMDSEDKNYGRTALSWAAVCGHEAVVELLLKMGQVRVDSEDIDGRTALSLAATYGHDAAVELLLEASQTEVDSKDNRGRTALLWSAKGGHEAGVELLLKMGEAKIDSKDKKGRTALLLAAKGGHEAVVEVLLKTDQAEVNAKDKYGRTALSWAATYGHDAIVELLLKTGQVEVDSKDNDGRTALSWAAMYGHDAVVKLLLNAGQVEVDSKDNDGRTALSWAATYGRESIVELLLKTGQAEVDSKNYNGRTPLSLAAEDGHEAVVELLRSFGSETLSTSPSTASVA